MTKRQDNGYLNKEVSTEDRKYLDFNKELKELIDKIAEIKDSKEREEARVKKMGEEMESIKEKIA